jgi:hypothetical protein
LGNRDFLQICRTELGLLGRNLNQRGPPGRIILDPMQ